MIIDDIRSRTYKEEMAEYLNEANRRDIPDNEPKSFIERYGLEPRPSVPGEVFPSGTWLAYLGDGDVYVKEP